MEAKVLGTVDVNVHIEALAWGAKRNFIMMDKERDPALSDAPARSCTQTSFLQSTRLAGLDGHYDGRRRAAGALTGDARRQQPLAAPEVDRPAARR